MNAPVLAKSLATNLYFDQQFGCQAVKLLPSEYYVTNADMMLVTVLGSCVAACVRDTVSGIGGMNHFMLPDENDSDRLLSASMRYGAYAMEMLLNELIKAGARRERLEAKVFGGGAVLAGMTTLNIGDRNAQFVLRYLEVEQIKVTAQDLLGAQPRKVCFMPRSGKVMVKKLGQRGDDAIVVKREQDYARQLRGNQVRGAVELFSSPARAARQASVAEET
ncbi:chemotaxis protein CheD [Pandoraea thiooxydans]|uniref:Probable chemoreceptor glutamine deamidase CheD n=1 Tax=Pandoraea thiooxydans TaxID=445709 RepID=A0A0G3EWD4_9BURK|nr:chemoreceptor glutamine deamidase CheD [Pandoraea thiooxydans]AKJ69702.1 chemotaxis protein CheD [Pandoraea thiooxydans]APR97431.1 chemotaxis protein CheD [Pandoraea thiooxydans]